MIILGGSRRNRNSSIHGTGRGIVIVIIIIPREDGSHSSSRKTNNNRNKGCFRRVVRLRRGLANMVRIVRDP